MKKLLQGSATLRLLPLFTILLAMICACSTGGDSSEFDALGKGQHDGAGSVAGNPMPALADVTPNDRPEDDIPSVKDILAKYRGKIKTGPRSNDRLRINSVGRLADVFNDSNRNQYLYAEALGISPIHSLADAYHARRPLIHIKSNEYYFVDSLTHSMPFLVPEAALLLKRIGANFIDSLGSRGADGYRIKVTSLLRTPTTVKRLRRVNVNATDSSTHQFGTTVDISYVNFACADSTRTINQEDLKNLLAEVLRDLRATQSCLVKYERKTGCFHLTVTH